jgi:hypothetical protein
MVTMEFAASDTGQSGLSLTGVGCMCTRKTTLSAGADVHRACQCADGHGARCRRHARAHGHADAHVHVCEPEPTHAYVHGYGRAYGDGNRSWVVLLSNDFCK